MCSASTVRRCQEACAAAAHPVPAGTAGRRFREGGALQGRGPELEALWQISEAGVQRPFCCWREYAASREAPYRKGMSCITTRSYVCSCSKNMVPAMQPPLKHRAEQPGQAPASYMAHGNLLASPQPLPKIWQGDWMTPTLTLTAVIGLSRQPQHSHRIQARWRRVRSEQRPSERRTMQ